MAVRVKVRIDCSSTNKELDSIALVNTAFESRRNQLLLPLGAAKKLGIWPNLPPTAKIEVYGTAGGPSRKYVILHLLKVRVVTEDEESPTVGADAVISDVENEVFMNDKLSGKLGIGIEDIGKGLWRLKADLRKKLRRSGRPKYW